MNSLDVNKDTHVLQNATTVLNSIDKKDAVEKDSITQVLFRVAVDGSLTYLSPPTLLYTSLQVRSDPDDEELSLSESARPTQGGLVTQKITKALYQRVFWITQREACTTRRAGTTGRAARTT